MNQSGLSSLEICAGAGGQALGLEQAGFWHQGLVEIDRHCCSTLRLNRPSWRTYEMDLRRFTQEHAEKFIGIDLLSGGLPCPPFSVAGKQLGALDDRNLFPCALNLVQIIRPKAVMIENVRGLLGAVFQDYRQHLKDHFQALGYQADWRLLNASDFGVPQLRPRVVIIALRKDISNDFAWPSSAGISPMSVGDCLFDLMSERGWRGAQRWRELADDIAPTIVGGSLKHGGPDLGPTRAKQAWQSLGVDGKGIAFEAPERDFVGMPRLTVRMVARIQGFPDSWEFGGRKTAAYRQVGNAFPPPVAKAVGEKLYACISAAEARQSLKAVG